MLKFLRGNWKSLLGLSTTMALFALAILNPALTSLISGVVIGGTTPFAFLAQLTSLASAAVVSLSAGLGLYSTLSLVSLTARLFSGYRVVAVAEAKQGVAVVEPVAADKPIVSVVVNVSNAKPDNAAVVTPKAVKGSSPLFFAAGESNTVDAPEGEIENQEAKDENKTNLNMS